MINKKSMTIIVLDDFGEDIIIFGEFHSIDVKKVFDIAEKHEMSCLGCIDISRDTYFNYIQSKDVKQEVDTLRKYKDLNKNLLDTLFRAADITIKSDSYMKITCGRLAELCYLEF